MSERFFSPPQSGEPEDNHTLPAWIYRDPHFFDLERDSIFSTSWQIACHVSEIPQAGDYVTLNLMRERAVVTRLDDGTVTAFHNTCRHRAHAVVSGESGNCSRVHVCPYHGWTYNKDGTLRGIPGGSPADLKQAGRGLPTIETEVFAGFVWIRLASEGPSVAERLAKHAGLLEAYRIDEMTPNHDLMVEVHDVDWKNMIDNYLEGYHVAVGHPGLNEMMDPAYDVDADSERGVCFATHRLRETPAGSEAAQEYMRTLPPVEHLPGDYGRRWSYLTVFPITNIGLQPDCVDYFVIYPLGPGRAMFRSQSFSLPGSSAEMQRASELAGRVWGKVQAEDNALTQSVQRGLEGSSYQHGFLSPREPGVRAFRDWIRARLPVAKSLSRPWTHDTPSS